MPVIGFTLASRKVTSISEYVHKEMSTHIESITVDRGGTFIFKAWTPMNVNQIKRACARLAKEQAGDC